MKMWNRVLRMKRPKPKKNPDFKKLVKYLENGMKFTEDEKHHPKDFIHHIFGETMVTVYGEDIFKWYDKYNI